MEAHECDGCERCVLRSLSYQWSSRMQQAPQYKAGDRVRLRIVNAGASSYFWLGYGGGKMTVIANDGNEVEPIEVDRLIVGVSETYDVVVTHPNKI